MTREVQEEIIGRRANGESVQGIADVLGISKTTVISYTHKLSMEIQNAVNLQKELMLVRLGATVKVRTENKVRLLSKLENEILTRDLADVSFEKLVLLWKDLNALFVSELQVKFSGIEEYDPLAELQSYSKPGKRVITWDAS